MSDVIALDKTITVLASVATQHLLGSVLIACREETGIDLHIRPISGSKALDALAEGVHCDAVLLSTAVVDRALSAAYLAPGSQRVGMCSRIAAAVRDTTECPDLSTEPRVREAVRTAKRIGVSTGPSGQHLMRQFLAWGLDEYLDGRLVIASPGVPVGTLLTQGAITLGFQQRSELIHVPGIQVIECLPPCLQQVTTFSVAAIQNTQKMPLVAAFIEFLGSPSVTSLMRRHGMEPPTV